MNLIPLQSDGRRVRIIGTDHDGHCVPQTRHVGFSDAGDGVALCQPMRCGFWYLSVLLGRKFLFISCHTFDRRTHQFLQRWKKKRPLVGTYLCGPRCEAKRSTEKMIGQG